VHRGQVPGEKEGKGGGGEAEEDHGRLQSSPPTPTNQPTYRPTPPGPQAHPRHAAPPCETQVVGGNRDACQHGSAHGVQTQAVNGACAGLGCSRGAIEGQPGSEEGARASMCGARANTRCASRWGAGKHTLLCEGINVRCAGKHTLPCEGIKVPRSGRRVPSEFQVQVPRDTRTVKPDCQRPRTGRSRSRPRRSRGTPRP
jgi:hypothetical protein